MSAKKLRIIGDLINNAYGRARNAFTARNLEGYQNLAKSQAELGVDFLDLNIDGTRQIQVKLEEMRAFLPDVIPAIQAVTRVPLCMDNPSVEFHKVALKHYDRSKGGAPILNSIAASREHLDEMIELVAAYDTLVIVMASEKFADGGSAQCLNPQDVHATAKHFVELLVTKAGRRNDQILVDTGLAPVGADTYGLVNIGLDAMRLIRQDPDLRGVHLSVGLSNFAWGTPKHVRHELEKAYLTMGMEAGLDFAIANPESATGPLPEDHPMVAGLRHALQEGRAAEGESQEMAGFRQAEAVMKIWSDAQPAD
ncbi:MAG: dihydropteroate synthase [Verrucomicrobiota bacterium]|jgi:5-methyltetrahydrofolate--homocysteine methyltransferase